MNELIIIGKIIGVHGVRGELKVFPITDNARRFLKLKKCYLSDEGLNKPVEHKVASARMDRGNVLIKLEGYEDRTVAESLKGKFISVDREDAVKLPKDSFFIVDLIGLDVIDDDKGSLGKVSDVFETGANFVITIKRPGKKELLIPFLNAVCYNVDIEGGVINTKLPEGLYEIYE